MSDVKVLEVMTQIVDLTSATGFFESVNMHEATSEVASYTAALMVNTIDPIDDSGLDATSVRVEFKFRIYGNLIQEPKDDIDPNLGNATNAVMRTMSGHYTLNSKCRNVDLLGALGVALSSRSGYLKLGSNMYRIMDITIPVIIDDVWEQVA